MGEPMKKPVVLAPLFMLLVVGGAPLTAEAQEWSWHTSGDKMTGEIRAFATSPDVNATEPLDFPYRGMEAELYFGCNRQGDEWAYIAFSEEPNITDTETYDGWDGFSVRARWDDNVTTMDMRQDWGERFVHFQSDGRAIANIAAARSVLIEFNWYGSGDVYFEFPLDGSADAIASAREACRG